jgi:uncharacterized protein (DUF1501 family)
MTRDTCSCAGFSRSAMLRGAAAQAGRGLPSIEPGMPMPAGTGLTRRSFMSRAAGLAFAVYGAASLGPKAFEAGIAQAAAAAPDQRILVSVFLAGGADSLGVLAPTGDPLYAGLRPTLKLGPGEGTEFADDSRLRWHPQATDLATLHGEGKLTVMPAIGYTGANQSHFTSRHYYEVGETNPYGRWGWLGRFLDQHGAADNPLQGLTLGYELQPALAARDVPVATVSRPDDYYFYSPGVYDPIADPMLSAFGNLGELPTTDAGLAYARGAVAATGGLRRQLEPFQDGFTSPVSYPDTDFGRRLSALAAMIKENLPLRVVAIEADGSYDTHSNQAQELSQQIGTTSAGLLAFQRDLEARGLADRVLVHVWSEFGRRPAENGSGTDHGAAGLGLVMGQHASGDTIGEFPGLAQLDEDDNLRSTSDFRGVYAALMEQWMGVDAGAIVPGATSTSGVFARPSLVA